MKRGSCSEAAAEGGSGGKGRSDSMRAESALAAVGSGTLLCIRAGQWAAGGGAEGIRAAANPNSRARSTVRTVHALNVVLGALLLSFWLLWQWQRVLTAAVAVVVHLLHVQWQQLASSVVLCLALSLLCVCICMGVLM